MKSDRLLSALLLLQAHGRLTARVLAERLEVSLRTVHRDMESLAAAGVPIYALRGARGGWQLDEDWRTRVPGLDRAELQALLLAQPRVVGDTRLARAAERALDKLMASLPAAMRAEAASQRQRLHVDMSGWTGVPEDLSLLPVVQDAVSLGRRLALRYRPARRESGIRTVDPLGLVAKGIAWYLVADTAEGLRSFRVSRIEEARVLEEAAARPAGFDLAAYWTAATEALRKRWTRYEATLRLAPAAALSVTTFRPTAVAEAPDGPDGWRTLRVPFDDEEHACFVVLGLGARVDVLEPEALRERTTAELRAALARASTRAEPATRSAPASRRTTADPGAAGATRPRPARRRSPRRSRA
jgi:predicted DNA-binding transcriptional regulator YafY